ncbi:MAG: hypothetical protein RIS18_1088 [Actinomycetota bacterium]|jgi:hypothetical protein
MQNLKISTAASVTFLFAITFLSIQAANPTSPKLPCRIEVSNAHISKDVWIKTGKRAVKVDAFSTCHLPQSRVTLTVELWKTGQPFNHFVFKTITRSPGVTSPRVRVENFNTYIFCKNRDLTFWYGVAYSKAFIGGKWQFARHVLSQKIEPIKCGT